MTSSCAFDRFVGNNDDFVLWKALPTFFAFWCFSSLLVDVARGTWFDRFIPLLQFRLMCPTKPQWKHTFVHVGPDRDVVGLLTLDSLTFVVGGGEFATDCGKKDCLTRTWYVSSSIISKAQTICLTETEQFIQFAPSGRETLQVFLMLKHGPILSCRTSE